MVYDCSSAGIQRQPFPVWMLDCLGPIGVKRLKPDHRSHIPGGARLLPRNIREASTFRL